MRKLNRAVAIALSAAVALVAAVPVAAQGGVLVALEPVLQYEMDFDRTPSGQIIDSSPSGNHGNMFNFDGVSGANGEEDSGTTTFLIFNGDAQYVVSENEEQGPSEFTLEAVFRTTSTGGKLLGFEDAPSGLGVLYDRTLYIDADGFLRFHGSGISTTVVSLGPVNDGEWHSVTATTAHQSGEVFTDMVIDGISQGGTRARIGASNYPGHWRIGGGNLSGFENASSNYFAGDIQSVRVFDDSDSDPQPTPTPRPLPESPIDVTPVEPTANRLIHLDMSIRELEPNSIADLSGNQNRGIVYNVSEGKDSFFVDGAAPGGAYVSLDGVDDVVGTQGQLDAPMNGTMAVWFRTETANGKIFSFENNIAGESTEFDRHLFIRDDGYAWYGNEDEAENTLASFRSREVVTDGEWHFAAVTLETVGLETFMHFFLDGEYQISSSAMDVPEFRGYWRLGNGTIGSWTDLPNPALEGDIGPFIVYDEPLSPAEIAWIQQRYSPDDTRPGVIGDELDPWMWLDAGVNPGVASIMQDRTGNGNDGTLSRFDDPNAAYRLDPEVGRYLTLDGTDDVVLTQNLIDAPDEFSIVVQFRTDATAGKIVGFEDSPTASSGTNADRHMYIDNAGRLRFGARNDFYVNVQSQVDVDDGEWHVAAGTSEWTGDEYILRLYIDGEPQGLVATALQFEQYQGYWRMGNGSLLGWPGAQGEAFAGDIKFLQVYDRGLTPDEVMSIGIPAPVEPVETVQPQPTPTITVPDHELEEIKPRVDVTSEIDGDTITLNMSMVNVDLFDSTVWVVREEDGEEFLVGDAAQEMTWEGEAATSRYTVEVRQMAFVGEGEPAEQVVASGSVPVIVQPSTAAEIAVAVGVTVAVAGAVSAASAGASGTWIYDWMWRFLRIAATEKVRRHTRRLDVSSVPSWIAAVVATILMALLIAAGKPGALGVKSFPEALVVSTPVVVLYRSLTLAGGVALAYYTQQKPKYLIWAAGTASFAFSSVVLHTPFGYTGYLDRGASGDKARDLRFTLAGFAAMLAFSGVFLMIGLLTKMSFGEAGITLILGVLAVTMLPFPLMAGNKVWAWNRVAGVASGVVGLVPYIMFQYGLIGPAGVVLLATFGLLAFGGIMIAELWIVEESRLKENAAAVRAARTAALEKPAGAT